MKKNKNLIIIGVLLVAVLLGGFLYLKNKNESQELKDFTNDSTLIDGGQEKPEESSEDEDIQVDIVSSITFDLEGLDFRFAIVKLRIQTEDETINLGLEHFKTSEGIQLDQVDTYIRTLEAQGYFLGKQNVWFEILSNEPSTMVNVFMPIENDELKEIEIITDLYSPRSMKVSLENPKGTKSMLQYEAEDIITDGKTYQMLVSKAYEITGDTMVQKTASGEEEFLLPSTTAVYAFNIKMISLWGDKIVIEEAQYIPDNSKEVFTALDSSIQSMKYSNIIGREVVEEESGDLFFVTYNPASGSISYKGVLKLKIKGEENWITIQVDLN